jgi:type IV pilus assembly protein PilQ
VEVKSDKPVVDATDTKPPPGKDSKKTELSPSALEQQMVAAKAVEAKKGTDSLAEAAKSDKPVADATDAKPQPEKDAHKSAVTEPVKDTSIAKPVVAPEDSKVAASAETKVQNVASTKIASILLEGQGTTSPAVVITFNGVVEHTMTRTAPSEYVITLHEASAEARLLQQTWFASQQSSGIRSVRTVADGKNTLVRIFTQPSSYLTARQNGSTLKIQETQDLTQIARDIRAQIAPAAAKESEAGKDAADGKVAKDANADTSKAPKAPHRPESGKLDEGVSGPDDSELAAIKGSSLTYTGRLISLDLQDADIDSALRIIAEVSNLNIVAGDGVVGKVTLKLVDVPWDQALEVILKSHGLDKVLEGNVLRVAPVDKLRTERESFKQAKVAEEELEPLSVKYMRVSYAKAAEIKSLVETVLSERGTVAFDERSNQLVVKDTRKGLQNVTELIKKIDLRTPQILLETQIIEANRNLSRQLGAELGFQYIQSPATGNGTGLNFPSAIAVGGSADPTNASSITGSAFPVASSASLGSAVTMLFDSADGTKSLALRLSQLEQEGQVRIISKPAVATTNNKAAEIKSVEKYRVKLPNGGLSIASGSGATSSGSGDVATQTIEAGIVLNVTPQASPDYYILLDIKAKSSSFGAKSVDGIPNEIERSASSSVLVSSGQTFALGGIYKINEQDRISGVPFFKDIPVLGTLFRNTTTEQADEELLFFITPRIVEGSFEDATVKVIS